LSFEFRVSSFELSVWSLLELGTFDPSTAKILHQAGIHPAHLIWQPGESIEDLLVDVTLIEGYV
jgi:hypothetical protein